MLKELFLLPRTLWSIWFTVIGMYVTFTRPSDPIAFVGLFVFIFAFSFLWQYVVLHFALSQLNMSQRRLTLLVWFVVSTVIGTWCLHLLSTIDWTQRDVNALASDLSWRMLAYMIAAQMFVAGACARRAYQRYKAL